MADPVEDKHRRNFCEYFQLSREPLAASAGRGSREAEARRKLEQLFKRPPEKADPAAD
jgi:hypothetical protein